MCRNADAGDNGHDVDAQLRFLQSSNRDVLLTVQYVVFALYGKRECNFLREVEAEAKDSRHGMTLKLS
jgi:hypothetical protein